MKKILLLGLCVLLTMCIFSGCNKTALGAITEADGTWEKGALKAFGLENVSSPEFNSSFGINITEDSFNTELITSEIKATQLIQSIFNDAMSTKTVTLYGDIESPVTSIKNVKTVYDDGFCQYLFQYTTNSKTYTANITVMPISSGTDDKLVDVMININAVSDSLK